MRLLLDTNIIVDFIAWREPFAQKARLLLLCGKVGEFELWVSSSQVADLIYIASDGGKRERLPAVCEKVDALLCFVNVFAPDADVLHDALTADWDDPEDALIHVIAHRIRASAIITRNLNDFEKSLIPVKDCEVFFDDLEKQGIVYDTTELR